MVVDRESQASSWLSICRHFWTVLEGPGRLPEFQLLKHFSGTPAEALTCPGLFLAWISEKYEFSP